MAGSNTLKAYDLKVTALSNFNDAEANCRADGAWIAAPRTSADLADIQGYNCKNSNELVKVLNIL